MQPKYLVSGIKSATVIYKTTILKRLKFQLGIIEKYVTVCLKIFLVSDKQLFRTLDSKYSKNIYRE